MPKRQTLVLGKAVAPSKTPVFALSTHRDDIGVINLDMNIKFARSMRQVVFPNAFLVALIGRIATVNLGTWIN